MRRLRHFALAIAMLVLAAVALLAFVARPALSKDRDRVDEAWRPLRPPLVQRYGQLRTALDSLKAAGIGGRKVVGDTEATLARWDSLLHTVAADADTESEVGVANTLEGELLRLHAAIAASARLKANADVVGKFHAVDVTTPEPKLVDAYNAAARRYQNTREGLLRRYAADVFGFDARPNLEMSGSG